MKQERSKLEKASLWINQHLYVVPAVLFTLIPSIGVATNYDVSLDTERFKDGELAEIDLMLLSEEDEIHDHFLAIAMINPHNEEHRAYYLTTNDWRVRWDNKGNKTVYDFRD